LAKGLDLHKAIDTFRVAPGKSIRLKGYDTEWNGMEGLGKIEKDAIKGQADDLLAESVKELTEAQGLLWANNQHSLLVILQGMDASGKDSIVKHVMSGINPQGCQVTSFKVPSEEELDHDFLWRYSKTLPQRGGVGIFNSSYYEEVLVVRVHPELLERQRLPKGKRDNAFWQARYEDINAFERYLSRNGTLIVKFFLNVSKEEQKKRLLERTDDPRKRWKFSVADLAEREYWDDYMKAFEEAINSTSTEHAPWYIIPADHKWIARSVVASILASAIGTLKLEYPRLSDEKNKELEEARKRLMSEPRAPPLFKE
jgi:PPK2 family polyphosphate:nucleotide phosphotransferase